jgi:hypothetical protein
MPARQARRARAIDQWAADHDRGAGCPGSGMPGIGGLARGAADIHGAIAAIDVALRRHVLGEDDRMDRQFDMVIGDRVHIVAGHDACSVDELRDRNERAVDEDIVQRRDAEVARREAVIEGARPDHDRNAVGVHAREGARIDTLADPADRQGSVGRRQHLIAQTELFHSHPSARRGNPRPRAKTRTHNAPPSSVEVIVARKGLNPLDSREAVSTTTELS